MLKLGNLSAWPWTLYQNRRRKRKFKDSDELEANKAYKKNKKSTRAQFDKKEEKSIWCCSPKYSDVLKAKAAVFSSLPRQEQLVCLTAASFAMQDYDSDLVYSRKKKKELSDRKGWGSYLTNEELAMIGELDGKEATNLYNGSRKNPYAYSQFDDSVYSYSIERMKHGLDGIDYKDEMVSTWIGEPFVDRDDILTKDEDDSEEILEDEARTKLLEEHESYWMKMEEAMFRKQVLSI